MVVPFNENLVSSPTFVQSKPTNAPTSSLAPYSFSDWHDDGNDNTTGNYWVRKFSSVVKGIPPGVDWNTSALKMYQYVPDKIGDYNIDHKKTTKYNNGFNIYVIAYSTDWKSPIISFGNWANQGSDIVAGLNRTKYQAVVYGVPSGRKWEDYIAFAKTIIPKSLDSKQIDPSQTQTWNQTGIALWMIIYSAGDPLDKANLSFSAWTKDGIVMDMETGMKRNKYYARILGVRQGESWSDAYDLIYQHFKPTVIEGDTITEWNKVDKGVLGLFMEAFGQPSYGFTLNAWGSTAFGGRQFQAQVNFPSGNPWERFNDISLQTLVKQGLIPDQISGQTVDKTSLSHFQSTFGVFVTVNVEESFVASVFSSVPWYVDIALILGGTVGIYAYFSKGKGENITIFNKK